MRVPAGRPRGTFYPWKRGEHMAIIGDTGSGKSTLAAALLQLRTYYVAVQTKADDVRYAVDKSSTNTGALRDARNSRVLLDLSRQPDAVQARTIREALAITWEQGGWTEYVDELFYWEQELKLGKLVTRHLTQGRSLGLSVVVGMQRPVLVTRFAISQATHVISFHTEGRDAKTLSDATSPRLGRITAGLARHRFAWFYRPDVSIRAGMLQDLY